VAWWNLWLEQAQSSNNEDRDEYSHGVFSRMRLPPSPSYGQSAIDKHRKNA